MLVTLLLHLTAEASSKLTASKVSGSGGAGPGLPESDTAACPAMPLVFSAGKAVEAEVSETFEVDDRRIWLRQLHPELQLTYVHNIISDEELDQLISLADERKGWQRSPLKAQAKGDVIEGDSRRTSSTCIMLWPRLYAGREAEIRDKGTPSLISELEITSQITSRAAAMFTAAGLDITPDHIEPLQLVRYLGGELFAPHHDYHSTGESSVQGEQRAFTMLLFGRSLESDDGGQTHFPLLDVSVVPRRGDALVWMNVDEHGEPNPRSLHEGRPPLRGEKVVINVWVADRPFSRQGLEKAVKA